LFFSGIHNGNLRLFPCILSIALAFIFALHGIRYAVTCFI
jgi:hypothetical protein